MFSVCPKENVITLFTILVSGMCQECAQSSLSITWISQVSPAWDIPHWQGWIYSAHLQWLLALTAKSSYLCDFSESPGWVFHVCSGQIYVAFLIRKSCFPSRGPATVLLENTFVNVQQLSPGGGQKSSEWQSWASVKGGGGLEVRIPSPQLFVWSGHSIHKSLSKTMHLNSFIEF